MSLKNLTAGTLGILIISAIIVLALLFPLAVIWAGNTLFGLGLQYSFWNWLAVIIIGIFIRGVERKKE